MLGIETANYEQQTSSYIDESGIDEIDTVRGSTCKRDQFIKENKLEHLSSIKRLDADPNDTILTSCLSSSEINSAPCEPKSNKDIVSVQVDSALDPSSLKQPTTSLNKRENALLQAIKKKNS